MILYTCLFAYYEFRFNLRVIFPNNEVNGNGLELTIPYFNYQFHFDKI